MALNVREKAFAEEYIKNCGNAYQAAIAAGYSEQTANCAASWLDEKSMKKHDDKSRYKPELAAYIAEKLGEISSERTADAAEVVEFLTSVMRGEQREQVLKFTGAGKQSVVSIAAPMRERTKAAELLGKVHGIFTERVDVSGTVPVVISGGDKLED